MLCIPLNLLISLKRLNKLVAAYHTRSNKEMYTQIAYDI